MLKMSKIKTNVTTHVEAQLMQSVSQEINKHLFSEQGEHGTFTVFHCQSVARSPHQSGFWPIVHLSILTWRTVEKKGHLTTLNNDFSVTTDLTHTTFLLVKYGWIVKKYVQKPTMMSTTDLKMRLVSWVCPLTLQHVSHYFLVIKITQVRLQWDSDEQWECDTYTRNLECDGSLYCSKLLNCATLPTKTVYKALILVQPRWRTIEMIIGWKYIFMSVLLQYLFFFYNVGIPTMSPSTSQRQCVYILYIYNHHEELLVYIYMSTQIYFYDNIYFCFLRHQIYEYV